MNSVNHNSNKENEVYFLLYKYFSFPNGRLAGPKKREESDFVYQELCDYEYILGQGDLKRIIKSFLITNGIKNEMDLIELTENIIKRH